MKKLKFNNNKNLGKALTREELRDVLGNDGISLSLSISVKIGCSGLSEGASCYYIKPGSNEIMRGICKYLPISGLQCWGG